MRDPESGDIQWISDDTFESPIAYAVESSTGASLGVHFVPDAPMAHLFSEEYVEGEIERQLDESHDRDRMQNHGSQHDETVFGSLGNGELFALPLGRRSFRNGHGNGRNGLSHVPRLSSTAGTSAKHLPAKIPPITANGDWQHGFEKEHAAIAAGNSNSNSNTNNAGVGTALTRVVAPASNTCDQNSKNFPRCLAEMYGDAMEKLMIEQQQQIEKLSTSSIHQSPNTFYQKEHNDGSAKDQYQSFMNIMTSWIPPAVALAFVVSFELGRRERAKTEAAKLRQELEAKEFQASSESITFRRELSDENLLSHNEQPGVIHVSEEVLGYGGHGTVVYKGKLDGRFVAVKRMLKAYHASADREISLLIESDGHPNVVRYFLKEVRGDFVYLALELCDMNLQDLIVSLSKHNLKETMARQDKKRESTPSCSVNPALRKILFEIVSGIKHIHSLRIVHRDMKPANILLAKISRQKSRKTLESDDDAIYEAFNSEKYLPKISDMGLGKQLAGQSSFGFSTFNTSLGPSMNQGSTIAGAGPGSVGWQAPEVMAQRLSPEAGSLDDISGPESMLEASPVEISLNGRTSRSVDIFSLGCIFYCTLLPGFHPFGEWYEREANIMKNRPAIDALKELSIDAWDLVSSMLNRNPKARPTASQICNHPFFWSASKRLTFVCDFSDRLESESESKATFGEGHFDRLLVERHASNIIGLSWTSRIDACLLNHVQKFRSYDTSLVRDCLRLIRNKHHHFDELPAEFKEIAPDQKKLFEYFEARFPYLLFHCYSICRDNLKNGDQLAVKFDILCTPHQTLAVHRKISPPSIIEERCADSKGSSPPASKTNMEVKIKKDSNPKDEIESLIIASEFVEDFETQDSAQSTSRSIFAQDIITWQGSSSAAALNCRGWIRSEDEWVCRANEKNHKRDNNLIRCAEDARFRTRLCNHWDTSQGTYCPMLKKHKCDFAHGPAELRVKGGKKNRWGKLVDTNGNNSNPQHSGGEDTYGAARQIENSRKEEGKWSKTPKKPRAKGKKATKA
jgi:serine/threonine-protein kinase/endoribonuclease IRE1